MASLSCQASGGQGQGQGCLPMATTEYDNSAGPCNMSSTRGWAARAENHLVRLPLPQGLSQAQVRALLSKLVPAVWNSRVVVTAVGNFRPTSW